MKRLLETLYYIKSLSNYDVLVLSKFLLGTKTSQFEIKDLPWVCAIYINNINTANMPEGCPSTITDLFTEGTRILDNGEEIPNIVTWESASKDKKSEIERCLECDKTIVYPNPRDAFKRTLACNEIKRSKQTTTTDAPPHQIIPHGCKNETDYYVLNPVNPDLNDVYEWGETKPDGTIHNPNLVIKFLNFDGKITDITCYNTVSLNNNAKHSKYLRDTNAIDQSVYFKYLATYYDPNDPAASLNDAGRIIHDDPRINGNAARISTHPAESFFMLEIRKVIWMNAETVDFTEGTLSEEIPTSDPKILYAIPIIQRRRVGTYTIRASTGAYIPTYYEIGAIHGQSDYPVYQLVDKIDDINYLKDQFLKYIDEQDTIENHLNNSDFTSINDVAGFINYNIRYRAIPRITVDDNIVNVSELTESGGSSSSSSSSSSGEWRTHSVAYNGQMLPYTDIYPNFHNASTIAISPTFENDGLIFVGTNDSKILIYKDYKCINTWHVDSGDPIHCIAYIPNNEPPDEMARTYLCALSNKSMYVTRLLDGMEPSPSLLFDFKLDFSNIPSKILQLKYSYYNWYVTTVDTIYNIKVITTDDDGRSEIFIDSEYTIDIKYAYLTNDDKNILIFKPDNQIVMLDETSPTTGYRGLNNLFRTPRETDLGPISKFSVGDKFIAVVRSNKPRVVRLYTWRSLQSIVFTNQEIQTEEDIDQVFIFKDVIIVTTIDMGVDIFTIGVDGSTTIIAHKIMNVVDIIDIKPSSDDDDDDEDGDARYLIRYIKYDDNEDSSSQNIFVTVFDKSLSNEIVYSYDSQEESDDSEDYDDSIISQSEDHDIDESDMENPYN